MTEQYCLTMNYFNLKYILYFLTITVYDCASVTQNQDNLQLKFVFIVSTKARNYM